MHGERGRSQHCAAEPAGQLFEARDEVDGRPDAGEIEPVAAANIAVKHLADMQSQPEAHALGDREVGNAARASRAAARPAAKEAAMSASPPIGKIASRPSPMNFNTSPPRSRIPGIWQSK